MTPGSSHPNSREGVAANNTPDYPQKAAPPAEYTTPPDPVKPEPIPVPSQPVQAIPSAITSEYGGPPSDLSSGLVYSNVRP